MAKPIYIPDISEEDFDSFRGILHNHLPETYDAWLKLSAQLLADYTSRGDQPVLVTVKANDFVQFLGTAADANAASLSKFARHVATRDVAQFDPEQTQPRT